MILLLLMVSCTCLPQIDKVKITSINGVTYGKQSLKERVSLDPDKGLTIGKEWKSGNGFQQHVLVKDGEPSDFPFAALTQIEHDYDGATYRVESSLRTGLVWICNVTHDVLGEHPDKIYINNIS